MSKRAARHRAQKTPLKARVQIRRVLLQNRYRFFWKPTARRRIRELMKALGA